MTSCYSDERFHLRFCMFKLFFFILYCEAILTCCRLSARAAAVGRRKSLTSILSSGAHSISRKCHRLPLLLFSSSTFLSPVSSFSCWSHSCWTPSPAPATPAFPNLVKLLSSWSLPRPPLHQENTFAIGSRVSSYLKDLSCNLYLFAWFPSVT